MHQKKLRIPKACRTVLKIALWFGLSFQKFIIWNKLKQKQNAYISCQLICKFSLSHSLFTFYKDMHITTACPRILSVTIILWGDEYLIQISNRCRESWSRSLIGVVFRIGSISVMSCWRRMIEPSENIHTSYSKLNNCKEKPVRSLFECMYFLYIYLPKLNIYLLSSKKGILVLSISLGFVTTSHSIHMSNFTKI